MAKTFNFTVRLQNQKNEQHEILNVDILANNYKSACLKAKNYAYDLLKHYTNDYYIHHITHND